MSHMFNRLFVLFVNDNGFIGVDDSIVNNVTEAQFFDSREDAEMHRIELYGSKRNEFQNTISILEWL